MTECAFRGTNWRTNFKPSFFLLFKVFKDVAGQIKGWGMFLTLSRCGEKFNDCQITINHERTDNCSAMIAFFCKK